MKRILAIIVLSLMPLSARAGVEITSATATGKNVTTELSITTFTATSNGYYLMQIEGSGLNGAVCAWTWRVRRCSAAGAYLGMMDGGVHVSTKYAATDTVLVASSGPGWLRAGDTATLYVASNNGSDTYVQIVAYWMDALWTSGAAAATDLTATNALITSNGAAIAGVSLKAATKEQIAAAVRDVSNVDPATNSIGEVLNAISPALDGYVGTPSAIGGQAADLSGMIRGVYGVTSDTATQTQLAETDATVTSNSVALSRVWAQLVDALADVAAVAAQITALGDVATNNDVSSATLVATQRMATAAALTTVGANVTKVKAATYDSVATTTGSASSVVLVLSNGTTQTISASGSRTTTEP